MSKQPKHIGVLALQGGFAEHMEAIEKCGATPVAVRELKDTKDLAGIILPGGESTVIMPLLKKTGLDQWLTKKAAEGMPIFGTCAGMIVLSQGYLNLLDITVDRNAYGGQLDSFEADLKAGELGDVHAVFIRAPKIKTAGKGVTVLAKHDGAPVLVEEKNILAACFHPELTENLRVHRYFLEKCGHNC